MCKGTEFHVDGTNRLLNLSVGERIFENRSIFGKGRGKYIVAPFSGHGVVVRHYLDGNKNHIHKRASEQR